MIDAEAAELELTCSADGALKNIALNGAPLSSGPHGTSGGRKIRAPQGSGLLRRGVNTLSVVVGSAGASPSAVGFYAEGHAVVGVRTKQADWPPTASTRSGETARVATSTDTLAGFHYGVRGTGQPAWLWTTLAEVADREEELADLHASASGDRRGDSILQDLREAEGGLARLQAKITRYVPTPSETHRITQPAVCQPNASVSHCRPIRLAVSPPPDIGGVASPAAPPARRGPRHALRSVGGQRAERRGGCCHSG